MQGVSALKGLEGPFLFGAMGPPAGARLSRVEAVFPYRANSRFPRLMS